MIKYIPQQKHPIKLIDVFSAWGDIPTILKQLIEDFRIDTKKALEFGVEFGYSTYALSNYFENVIGVDTFVGDIHSSFKENHFEQTSNKLKHNSNIRLIESDYKDFIKNCFERFDLIHIDIVHTYEDTFKCGEWAIQHADLTIFHDTESFLDVRRACIDLSKKFKVPLFNYEDSYGLGIIYNKK
jgi:hypothetical protein